MTRRPSPSPALYPVSPRSCRELFLAFTILALQGFGGVMAVVQRELVERRRWLTQEQFLEDWAVAQLMPGPNVINLSMVIGDRHFGWRGALSAVAGMLLAPLALVLLLAVLYGSVAHHPTAQGALRGMGAVAAGLVIGTGLKLLNALRHNPMGVFACAALGTLTAVAIAWLRWPMTTVLPAVGTVAVLWAWRRLPDTTPTS